MKADQLYQKLEEDFITPEMSDDWARWMDSISGFITDNFKERSMGLVCDFTDEVEKVYTAVFPSNRVMQEILDKGARNAMLFVHHPAVWDIRKAPEIFQQMDRQLLNEFRERNISIFNLHVPLDNYSRYSTSVSLARALGIKPEEASASLMGALNGVFGRTDLETVEELKEKFREAVGHDVSLYNYGDDKIADQRVAVIAGGGNDPDMLEEISEADINTFVTGISAQNEHSKPAHDFARENKINILGGTHYSTESFACIAMVDYFKKLDLPAEFIEDKPVMADL